MKPPLSILLCNSSAPQDIWYYHATAFFGFTSASKIHLALVQDDFAKLTPITEDDGFPSKYPDIAYGPARSAITWFTNREGNNEIYLRVVDLEPLLAYSTGSSINLRDTEQNALRVTHIAGDSISAYLAWNDDVLGLA